MPYTTRPQIEALIPAPVLIQALSDDGTGVELDGLIGAVIQNASDRVDAYLETRYTVPLDSPPASVRNACLVFACHMIYERRQIFGEKNPFNQQMLAVQKELEKIQEGTVALNATSALSPQVTARPLEMRMGKQDGL